MTTKNQTPTIERNPVDPDTFAKKTVILSMTLHRLGQSRLLATSALTESLKDADPESVSAHKKLFKDCPELKAIDALLGDVARYIASRALPSLFRGGVWLLPVASIEKVDAYLTDAAAKLPVLAQAFLNVYEKRVEESKARLKHLAEDVDYPSTEKVRRAFSIEWRFLTFDTPSSLKGISRALWEREAKKAAAAIVEAREAAVSLLRAEAKGLVDHMIARLTPGDDGKAKIIRGSVVDNLVAFLETFGERNEVAADEELAKTLGEVKALLEGVDSATLRDEEGVRDAVVSGMNEVKAKLDVLVTVAPKREISFEEE